MPAPPPQRRVRPLLPLLLLLAVASSLVAAAQGGAADVPPPAAFAALDIVPAGAQIYDITSGRTELPDGGEVIDNATGVRLIAPYIVFAEGDAIEATEVEVRGSFGLFHAATLRIDIATATLTASGDLQLERGSLVLEAAELRYDAAAEIASFAGPVRGNSPSFEAAGLLLDARSGMVLLLGPYRFQDGPFTLTSERDEGLLELAIVEAEGGTVYQAATEVAAATLERFATQLP